MKLIDISTPKYPNTFAKVSDEDFDFLNQWKWYAHNKGRRIYAARGFKGDNGRQKTVRMHRAILCPPDGMDVDHINHDGLDNRRENIRVCTRAQNMHNTKNITGRFKGVSFHKVTQSYLARISNNGTEFLLGRFATEVEAALAYNEASKRLHGEFGYQNEIDGNISREKASKARKGGGKK